MFSRAKWTTTSLAQEAESASCDLPSAVANNHSTSRPWGTMKAANRRLLALILSAKNREYLGL